MDSWPFLIVYSIEKYFTFQQIYHMDAFLYQTHEILSKKVAKNHVVLVFYNVIYDRVCGADLIVFDCRIYGRSELPLSDLVAISIYRISFIKDWKLTF
jgi:hypothetical protein